MKDFVRHLSIISFLSLSFVTAYASDDGQPVFENLQRRDSVLIGDQVRYGFRLSVEEGSVLEIADFPPVDGVEMITAFSLDTLKARKGRLDLEGSVVLTSFDSGSFVLPPFKVAVTKPDGATDTLLFRNDTLKVTTFPIDTATFVKHDIKGQIRYPVTFKEILPWMAGAILLCALAFAVYWLLKRRGRVQNQYREPAHITALRKLDSYRGSKYWEPSKQKLFYTGVTDAVREYIAARYGISAMEMTTSEIFRDLEKEIGDGKLCQELKVLFERADFVKFAKYVASEQENASAVPVAVKFVNDTYQHDIENADDGGKAAGTVKEE